MSTVKTILVVLLSIFAVAAIIGLITYASYNGFVSKQVDIKKAWSDVETQYQRRADIIPNMIKVANSSMNFQLKLTSEYAKAREGFDSANDKYRQALNNANDPQSIEKTEQAWNDVKSNWKAVEMTINARSESVPQANLDQMTELNNEMAAIENVIAAKRQAYNAVVADYNKGVVTIPGSLFANMWGFKELSMFEANKGAENAPVVDFNLS